MKIKLNAGAELDVLSKNELDSSLKDASKRFADILSAGIGYGKAVFSNINSAATSSTPPLLTTSTYSGGYIFLNSIGPNPGYVWSVKNLTYFNFPTTGADLLLNGYNNGDVVYAVLNGSNANGTTLIGSNGVIIHAGSDIYLGFRGTVTNGTIVVYYEEVLLEDIGKL